MAKKEKPKGPGRPAKAPEDKFRTTVMCASTFPPEIVTWLESMGDGSRNTGLNRVVREAYKAAQEPK